MQSPPKKDYISSLTTQKILNQRNSISPTKTNTNLANNINEVKKDLKNIY